MGLMYYFLREIFDCDPLKFVRRVDETIRNKSLNLFNAGIQVRHINPADFFEGYYKEVTVSFSTLVIVQSAWFLFAKF